MTEDYGEALWFLFMQVAQIGVHQGAEVVRIHGVTPPQYLVMKYLQETRNWTQQQLAEALFVTKGNISQMLKIMERDGLVVRQPTSSGSNHLSLTDEAKATLLAVDADHRQFANTFFAGLSNVEAEQFNHLLHKLIDTNNLAGARLEKLHDPLKDTCSSG